VRKSAVLVKSKEAAVLSGQRMMVLDREGKVWVAKTGFSANAVPALS
jgi:hypothetical protein